METRKLAERREILSRRALNAYGITVQGEEEDSGEEYD
jgi:hypothetical protein